MGLRQGSSGLLQEKQDLILDLRLEKAVILRLSPQKESAAVFGAGIIVIA